MGDWSNAVVWDNAAAWDAEAAVVALTTVTLEGYWDGTQMIPLTLDGYYNGTTMDTGLTIDGLGPNSVPNNPPPDPVPSTMTYGDSGGQGVGTHYTTVDVGQLHMRGTFIYDSTSAPTWTSSKASTIPASHDIVLQTKANNSGGTAYTDLLASMPATRAGKVYLLYWNEPEDQIEAGTAGGGFTLATWQSHCDALFDAIAASGKSYVIPAVSLMYATLQQSNKGLFGSTGARNMASYMRPGLRQIVWSHYALVKTDAAGHTYASTVPSTSVNTIKAYMDKQTGMGFSTVNGFPLAGANINDAQSIQNRINWFLDTSTRLAAAGSTNYLWYDILNKGVDDYRIEMDPQFLAAWQTQLTNAGQW